MSDVIFCGIPSLHKHTVFRSNKKQTVILPKRTNSLSRRTLHPIHANNLEMRYVFYIQMPEILQEMVG